MSKPKVVCDSSFLIAFAKINRLDLLLGTFEAPLLIPQEVYYEAVQQGIEKKEPDAFRIEKQIRPRRIQVKRIKKAPVWPFLGVGESAVIGLALENKIQVVCLDDAPARSVARRVGLIPVGTLGVLARSLKRGSVDKNQLFCLVDELINRDFRISAKILEQFRKTVQEM